MCVLVYRYIHMYSKNLVAGDIFVEVLKLADFQVLHNTSSLK